MIRRKGLGLVVGGHTSVPTDLSHLAQIGTKSTSSLNFTFRPLAAQGIAKKLQQVGNFIKSICSTVVGRGQVHMRHIRFEI